jgi:hypothetical protein
MSLEHELRQLYERAQDAPWPGERDAYHQFLRRKVRRGRAMAAGLALALAAIVGIIGVAPKILPKQDDIRPITPRGTVVQIPDKGLRLVVPKGWKISRRLTGGAAISGEAARQSTVGVILTPGSGRPTGATIAVTSDNRRTNQPWTSHRSDGRSYVLRQPPGMAGPGQYAIEWPTYCEDSRFSACAQKTRARVVLVTGNASNNDAEGQQQVLQARRQILTDMQPITNAMPAAAPKIPAETNVLLGKGGSGRTAWELWIEPIGGAGPGLGIHFPWLERHRGTGRGGESLWPPGLQASGTHTAMSCLTWVRGSGVLVYGLTREDAATVRIELVGRPPVIVSTFRADKPLPVVAFASPRLPPRTRLHRVVSFDAAGKLINSAKTRWGHEALCRHVVR